LFHTTAPDRPHFTPDLSYPAAVRARMAGLAALVWSLAPEAAAEPCVPHPI
jgi:hypothetical protein